MTNYEKYLISLGGELKPTPLTLADQDDFFLLFLELANSDSEIRDMCKRMNLNFGDNHEM
jgi:hypothetical protein